MDLVFELIASMLSGINNIYFGVILLLIVLFISEIKINEDNLKEKIILSYLLLTFYILLCKCQSFFSEKIVKSDDLMEY